MNDWSHLKVEHTSEYYFGISEIGGIPEFNLSGFMATATHRLMQGMRKGLNKILRELESATETWETQVKFDITVDKSGDIFTMTISTDNKIFRFVNDGTSHRYAVMTPDFMAKTMPGFLYSRRGRGGFSHIDKRTKRRGIEARDFVKTAVDLHGGFIELDLENIFHRTLDEFWRKV